MRNRHVAATSRSPQDVPVNQQNLPMDLPPGAPGSWCLVRASARGHWWAQLQVIDSAGNQVVRQVFLGPLRGGTRKTLLRMPPDAGALNLLFIGEVAAPESVEIQVLSRAAAAIRLLLAGWHRLPRAMRGESLGMAGRIRAEIGQAPARAGEAPPYSVWLSLYEPREEGVVLPASGIQIAVVPGAPAAARAATLAGLPGAIVTIASAADWKRLDAEHVLVLGEGEVLAPQALARFSEALASAPQAGFICADTDEIDNTGARRNPLFKPQPGPVFLQSGLATTGACLFRRQGDWSSLPLDAGAARLMLAQRCAPEAMLRIPAILTHLPAAPVARRSPAALPAASPKISIIIPTSCRSAHVLRCLYQIVTATQYENFEILLAVSRIDAADRRQARHLARAAAWPRVRILDLALPAFNYAQVNNRAAGHADGEYLLLLNDDVAPLSKEYLSVMMSHALAPGVGAVGARLLYGNDTIQHAGVIMGLAGLCEHAGRLANSAYGGLAAIDREVSAVTAACLLLPSRVFADIGGFDEAYAIALNDVDLCLRIRATGLRIIYAAFATLRHHESLSLGRHYEGVRASLEASEVHRLRLRWASVIADDPFYNPQAALEPEREWQPSFPPRRKAGQSSAT